MNRSVVIARGRVALLALVLLLLAAPPASAYKLAGYRLPTTRLTYFNRDSSIEWSVGQAAQVWNTSGAHVRFVRVNSQRAADVVIGIGTAASLPRPAVSLIRYTHRGIETLPTAVVVTDPTRDRYNMAAVVAHEFGHVLGLAHNHGCSLMNPSFVCETAPAGQWFCRILQPDDVAGAIRLYGGSAHLRTPPTCPRAEVPAVAPSLPGAPSQVSLVPDPTDPSTVHLNWTAVGETASAFSIDYNLGPCPTAPGQPGQTTLAVPGGPPNVAQSAQISLQGAPPGRYCFVIFARDAAGTPGPRSVPVFYVLPLNVSGG